MITQFSPVFIEITFPGLEREVCQKRDTLLILVLSGRGPVIERPSLKTISPPKLQSDFQLKHHDLVILVSIEHVNFIVDK